MSPRWLAALALAACLPKPKPVMRPLQLGTFGRYEITTCTSGGHLVRLTGELDADERGEVNSRERVETYRDRYLVPAIEQVADVLGYSFDATCAHSKLALRIAPPSAYGEVLHRIGETLRANPTDIDVAVLPER